MPRYEINVTVSSAQGHQTYAVEAESPEAVIAEFERNGGEFLEEEVEVMDFNSPEVIRVID